jgi:hypothetical protein
VASDAKSVIESKHRKLVDNGMLPPVAARLPNNPWPNP